MPAAAAEAKVHHSAIVLGATGNVGGRIVAPSDREPVMQEGGGGDAPQDGTFADPKVCEVVVHMDRLEREVAPHAQGVDVALAAFGVGKGSAKMPEEEVRNMRGNRLPAGLLPRRQGWRRSCVRGRDDSNWRGTRRPG